MKPYRSKRHLAYIREQHCAACGAWTPSQAAHYRLGTDGGMRMKPSDLYVLPLCVACHAREHRGNRTFWQGVHVMALIESYIKQSPVRAEIEQYRKEGDGR
jgi:hypothetical protein